MGKDKSIIARFTETMKGLADSASEALKAEGPPKADAAAAAYMPFAAEGLVTDPMLVPPVAVWPPKKRRAAKRTAKSRAGTTAKKAAVKKRTAAKSSARGAAKTSSNPRSKIAKTAAKRAPKRAGKKARRPPARTGGVRKAARRGRR